MSSQRDFFRHEPLEFLARLIEHEGEGSILAYLKQKGWAQQVMASPEAESLTGYSTFGVTVDLTASGLSRSHTQSRERWSFLKDACAAAGNTKEVASSVFAYIANLRQDVSSCRGKFEECGCIRRFAVN